MDNKKGILMALILGLSLIFSSIIGSMSFYKIKTLDNTLSTTGYAKVQVTSDLAKWSGNFTRTVSESNLKYGYSQMSNDLKIVKDFFKNNGFDEEELKISPVYMNENYKYSNSGDSLPKEYNLSQTVSIESEDIDKITNIADQVIEVINKGVVFSAYRPEYYYSDLAKTRIDLLSDAVKDARARAENITAAEDKKVAGLKNVSVGVTQVLPVNSINISDYGTYDTSEIEKEITITVKATFNLK